MCAMLGRPVNSQSEWSATPVARVVFIFLTKNQPPATITTATAATTTTTTTKNPYTAAALLSRPRPRSMHLAMRCMTLPWRTALQFRGKGLPTEYPAIERFFPTSPWPSRSVNLLCCGKISHNPAAVFQNFPGAIAPASCQ